MKTFSKYKVEIEFEGATRTEFVTSDSFVVGRSSECKIHIESKNLSRQHMKVSLVGTQIFIEDLKSTNGCLLDDESIESGKLVSYNDSQKLTLGKHDDVILRIYVQFDKKSDKNSSDKSYSDTNISVKEIKGEIDQIFNKDPMSLSDPAPKKAEHDYKEIMNQVEILKTEIIQRAEKRADKILDDAKDSAEKLLVESKANSDDLVSQARLSSDKMLAEAVEQSKNIKEQTELTDLIRKIDDKKTELERINEIILTCRDNLKSLELKNNEFIELEEKNTSLEISIKSLEAKKNSLSENQKDIEGQISLSSRELEKINKEKDYLNTLVHDVDSKHKLLVDENIKKDKELVQLNAKKDKLESEVLDADKKRKEYDQLSNSLNELQKNLDLKNTAFKDILVEIQNTSTDLKALKDLQMNLNSENVKQKTQIDLEKENVLKIQKEFEDFISKKQKINTEIEEINIKKDGVASELSALTKKSSVLDLECNEKIKKATDESDLIISQAKAKAQSEYIALMQKSKQDLVDKENSLLSHARTQSLEILEKANLEAKKVELEFKKQSDDIIQKAEIKAEKALKESQTRADELRDRAQTDYQKVIKDAELDADKIKAKTVAHMDEKKKDFIEFEKRRIKKSSELLKSELNVLLYSKLKLYLKEDSEDYTSRVKSSLDAAINSSMLSEVLDNDAEMYALLDDQVKIQQQKNKNYWRYTVPGTFVSVVVLYFAFPFFTKQIKEQSRKVASVSKQESKERIKKMDEASKEALFEFFSPKKTNDFKDTYTDRVLYTEGYAELSLEREYREDWILELQGFFTDQLNLSENALVPFISQEANMIKELVEQSKKINGKFIDQGILRMREIENDFLDKLKSNLKSDKDYKKVIAFQKKFYNKKMSQKQF